jgi:hypothetical protein
VIVDFVPPAASEVPFTSRSVSGVSVNGSDAPTKVLSLLDVHRRVEAVAAASELGLVARPNTRAQTGLPAEVR